MIGQGRERPSGLTGKVLIADLSGGYKKNKLIKINK